jgi:predicted Zn-dependent protease
VGGNRANKILEKGGDLVREFAVDESTITDEVQNQYGEAFHKDAIESGTFKLLQDERINSQLEKIMNDLLAVRENPSAIKYYIYAVDDPMVNAFTFGGRIYLTTGMYDKCKGKTALLYGIIGHEIGHSERGHIKRTIQEMQVSTKIFGENGMNLYQLKRLLTASFNQKFELEADYYGTDLAYRLRQDVCAAVIFWREMSKQENTYSQLEDFFRSHPFSELRAKCLETHIRTNFHRTCEG